MDLPFALRVAAGLVAESIDAVRKLPTEISTLPVTVVGTLAKLSFQLNQQLTDLAEAGDRLLSVLSREEAPPERTAWATIDDESETAAEDPQAAPTWDSVEEALEDDPHEDPNPHSGAGDEPAVDPDTVGDDADRDGPFDEAAVDGGAVEATVDDVTVDHVTVDDVTLDDEAGDVLVWSSDDPGAEPGDPAGEMTRALVDDVARLDLDASSTDGLADPDDVTDAGQGDPADPDDVSDAGQSDPAHPDDVAAADDGVPDGEWPEPADLTLAQLRSKVRSMDPGQLREELDREEQNQARPAHLTLLTNRLTTLERQDG